MLSIIVNFHNNRREAQATLHSLTRSYQRDRDLPYEVIALDHGSSQPLLESQVRAFGPEFRYRYVETSAVSPARAINAACREAAGDRLMVIVDGAHILSPGILRLAEVSFRLFASPFVATPSLHLGPGMQNLSMLEGYGQQAEDELLRTARWKEDGYQLFSIAGAFSDDSFGWFGCLFESGCFAIRKSDYLLLGGLDERFESRGGGLASPDFFQRALCRMELDYVMLLGEATFHQFHGGVASNAPPAEHPWDSFHQEYLRLRGTSFARALRHPFFLGSFPPQALPIARISAEEGFKLWQQDPDPSAS